MTRNLTGITINGTNVPISYNQDISNQLVGSVNIKAYIGSSASFQAIFNYGDDGIETHYFEVRD